MNLQTIIEGLLFISHKPLTIKEIAKVVSDEFTKEDIAQTLEELQKKCNQKESGIHIIVNKEKKDSTYQFVTNPELASYIEKHTKNEVKTDISQASLEALTVIAYRSPISKAELEKIRGVNCSVILRNLMMRGLIEEFFDKERGVQLYSITNDFLQWLGIHNVSELPDYKELHNHELIKDILEKEEESS